MMNTLFFTAAPVQAFRRGPGGCTLAGRAGPPRSAAARPAVEADPPMVPLDPAGVRDVTARLGPPAGPGLLALRHALAFRRPGLWGDSPSAPRSVLLVREGGGQFEAFGAGAPEPAVGWLAGHRRGFSLLAPDTWLDAVRARVGGVDRDEVETWSGGPGPPAGTPPGGVVTRRLTAGDLAAFTAAAPAWGLRGWGSYPALIEDAAAFGVPRGAGFAALAWVFDRAGRYDALGVYTAPRYRRLGLGRAAVSALVAHVVDQRGRVPLWSTRPDNKPSRALARALGFSPAVSETVLRWPPRPETFSG